MCVCARMCTHTLIHLLGSHKVSDMLSQYSTIKLYL